MEAISLDIKAAYDYVWHNGLLSKVQENQVHKDMIFWIISFLKNGKCRVVADGAEKEFSPECRSSQISPLCPTLFLVYVDDLLK